MLIFSVYPFGDKTIVTLYVNGVFHRSFIIDSSGISYIGDFEEKDSVRIEFVCMDYSETETIGLRVAMVNKYCMNNFVNYVKKNQMNIITMNSDKIEGEINIDKGQLLFTSIPYDEGWHIYENGKELKVLKLASAFVGVKLGEGKHRIVFKYVPQGWYLGLVITFLSWIIFLLWMGIIQSDKTKRTTKVF